MLGSWKLIAGSPGPPGEGLLAPLLTQRPGPDPSLLLPSFRTSRGLRVCVSGTPNPEAGERTEQDLN